MDTSGILVPSSKNPGNFQESHGVALSGFHKGVKESKKLCRDVGGQFGVGHRRLLAPEVVESTGR